MRQLLIFFLVFISMIGVGSAGQQIFNCAEFEVGEALVLDDALNPILLDPASSDEFYTGCNIEFGTSSLEGVSIRTSAESKGYTLTFPKDTTGIYQGFSVNFPEGTEILFEDDSKMNKYGSLINIPKAKKVVINTFDSKTVADDKGKLVITAVEKGSFSFYGLDNPNNRGDESTIKRFVFLSLYDDFLTVSAKESNVYALVNSYLFLFRDVGSGDMVQMEGDTLLFKSNLQRECSEELSKSLFIDYQIYDSLDVDDPFSANYFIKQDSESKTCNTILSLPSRDLKSSVMNHKIISGNDNFQFKYEYVKPETNEKTSSVAYEFLLNKDDTLTLGDIGDVVSSGELVLAGVSTPVKICGETQYEESSDYAFGSDIDSETQTDTSFSFYLDEDGSCELTKCSYAGVEEGEGSTTTLWCGEEYPRWTLERGIDDGQQTFTYEKGEWACYDGGHKEESATACFASGEVALDVFAGNSDPLIILENSKFQKLSDLDLYAKKFYVGADYAGLERGRYKFQVESEKTSLGEGSLILHFEDTVEMKDNKDGKSYRFDKGEGVKPSFDFKFASDNPSSQSSWGAFGCCGADSLKDVVISDDGSLTETPGCVGKEKKFLQAQTYIYEGKCDVIGLNEDVQKAGEVILAGKTEDCEKGYTKTESTGIDSITRTLCIKSSNPEADLDEIANQRRIETTGGACIEQGYFNENHEKKENTEMDGYYYKCQNFGYYSACEDKAGVGQPLATLPTSGADRNHWVREDKPKGCGTISEKNEDIECSIDLVNSGYPYLCAGDSYSVEECYAYTAKANRITALKETGTICSSGCLQDLCSSASSPEDCCVENIENYECKEDSDCLYGEKCDKSLCVTGNAYVGASCFSNFVGEYSCDDSGKLLLQCNRITRGTGYEWQITDYTCLDDCEESKCSPGLGQNNPNECCTLSSISCKDNSDCNDYGANYVCNNGNCEEVEGGVFTCQSNEDCIGEIGRGNICERGICEETDKTYCGDGRIDCTDGYECVDYYCEESEEDTLLIADVNGDNTGGDTGTSTSVVNYVCCEAKDYRSLNIAQYDLVLNSCSKSISNTYWTYPVNVENCISIEDELGISSDYICEEVKSSLSSYGSYSCETSSTAKKRSAESERSFWSWLVKYRS